MNNEKKNTSGMTDYEKYRNALLADPQTRFIVEYIEGAEGEERKRRIEFVRAVVALHELEKGREKQGAKS